VQNELVFEGKIAQMNAKNGRESAISGNGGNGKRRERGNGMIARAGPSTQALRHLGGRIGDEHVAKQALADRSPEGHRPSVDYYNLTEFNLAAEDMKKAFDLSDRVSEREKLVTQAHFDDGCQKDMEQGIKTYKLWAATYPHEWVPWVDIANDRPFWARQRISWREASARNMLKKAARVVRIINLQLAACDGVWSGNLFW